MTIRKSYWMAAIMANSAIMACRRATVQQLSAVQQQQQTVEAITSFIENNRQQ